MKLVRLSSNCMVNPEFVMEVAVNEYGNYILVKLSDGTIHSLVPNYDESKYQAMDRIKEEIEKV